MSPGDWLVAFVGVPEPLCLVCTARLRAARFTVQRIEREADAGGAVAAGHPRAVVLGSDLGAVDPATLARRLRGDAGPEARFLAYLAGGSEPGGDRMPFDVWLPAAPADQTAETLTALLRVARGQASGDQLWERLLDLAPDPILTVDAAGRIVFLNAQVEAVFGLPRRDLLGRAVELLVPLDLVGGHARHRREFRSMPRTRAMGQHGSLSARHRDGHEFPVEISLAPFDIDGESFVTATVRDVSERQRMENEVREGREWLEGILAATGDGILVEADDRIVFVNRACVQLFGYDASSELLGRHVSVLWAAEDSDRLFAYRRARLSGGPAPSVYEFAGQRRDGSTLALEASVAVRPIGGRVSVIAAVRDISERKQAEHERVRLAAERVRADAATERVTGLYRTAREANRLKDDFLATLSHELRTPLNVILGWARLLRGSGVDSATRERALASVERNSQVLADLVSQLLDVSRIVTGKLRLNRRPINPAALLSAAIDSIRPAAEAKGVSVALHAQAGLRPLLADANRLHQVLWNLLSNAVKFTPSGGRIDVTATASPSGLRISVSDTGAGITHEFLPFVFDRFRQGLESQAAEHSGLGLGLSIVRDLVQAHGGTVSARSAGEGLGSTFTIELPSANAPETTADPEAGDAPAARQTLNGLRILAVADAEDSQALLVAALRQQGAKVVVARSASEAVDAFGRHRFDGVVADVPVPDADGHALVRTIQAASEGRWLPTVAVSAGAGIEDAAAALAAGFHRHLSKPFDPKELADVLATMVDRPAD